MARFISIVLIAIISNTFVFAQKHAPIPMRLLVQETVLAANPFISDEFTKTAVPDKITSVSMYVYNNPSSNYLVVEVLGASQTMKFQLINTQGEEMYSGTIRGTQLIETESWPVGTYYFLCGTKRETVYVTR